MGQCAIILFKVVLYFSFIYLHEITFSILSGNTDDAFALDASSGIITVNNPDALNYDVITFFDLIVEVSDGSLTSNSTITINIENVTGLSPIASNANLKVYSIIGEKMLTTKSKQVDVHHLNSGVYFVLIKNEAGKSMKSIKLLKK